jgi:hypothetical protein
MPENLTYFCTRITAAIFAAIFIFSSSLSVHEGVWINVSSCPREGTQFGVQGCLDRQRIAVQRC